MKTPLSLTFALALATLSLHAQGTPTPPDPASDSQPAPTVPAAIANTIPLCTNNQLSLSTDFENGNFSGMQQSGALVVVRNIDSNACRFPAIPQLELLGKSGPLKATAKMDDFPAPTSGPGHMGHGPVVPPVIVAGGAELTSTLHWVAGPVYEHNHCIDSVSLRLATNDEKQTVPFTAHFCGEAGQPLTYDQTRFAPDPVFRPKPKQAH